MNKSSRELNKCIRSLFDEVLEGYKKWELKEMGENSEWVEEEMDKESLEFLNILPPYFSSKPSLPTRLRLNWRFHLQ